MGGFRAIPGAITTAPPVEFFAMVPTIAVDFADTKPHEVCLRILPCRRPIRRWCDIEVAGSCVAQVDEAVAQAKDSDVVVAFVASRRSLKARRCGSRSTDLKVGIKPASICLRRNKALEAFAVLASR